jgi:predicted anti-sigma-YlaC factor YlaD
MTCSDAVHRILEGDPLDLQGHGDSSLAEHIRTCPRCRAMAELVLEEERRLGIQMVGAVEVPDLDQLLDEALEKRPGTSPKTTSREHQGLQFKRFGLPLIPLAAAAAVVTLFLGGEPSLPGDSYAPPQRTAGLGVEVPEGQNAAVLATNNPDITVLWFF